MKKLKNRAMVMQAVLLIVLTLGFIQISRAQFVHPGCLGSQADLDRAKTEVAAHISPWIDDWQRLTNNSHAQLSYVDHPQSVVHRGTGGSCPAENYTYLYNDAAAIWACALRYQISGDTNYANKAVQIMNDWSATLTNISTCVSDGYLASGIYGYEMACGAELMRNYSGWAPSDFARYQGMMLNVFYPLNHDFLVNHNGACISHYWANWDLCNMDSMLAIGVLCDDTNIYNEALNYFYNGAGMGSISNVVVNVFPDSLGQWQESGRDQGHCMLGVGEIGTFCEIAWNQGLDLFGYLRNRVLEGVNYVAAYNLTNLVPYLDYINCDGTNQSVISSTGQGIVTNSSGRPIWELLYNHYVQIKGLNEPYLVEAAQIMRPEGGGGDYSPNSGGYDQLGYGTLLYSQTNSATPATPPAAPTGLTASAFSSCQINLSWTASSGADSYIVYQTTNSSGPYVLVASGVATTNYSVSGLTAGTTYYYEVSAFNSSGGEGSVSAPANTTTPAGGSLPAGWTNTDIGSVGTAGSSTYNCGTFTVEGAGSDIGGAADSFQYAYESMTGDGTIIARLASEILGGTSDKVGLMMRETAGSGSIMAFVLLDHALGESRFAYRTSTGGSATWVNGSTGTTLPLWYKLVRSGNTLTGYVSSNGVAWTTIGSATVTMASSITVGMAVCSRNTSALDTSIFDNVTAPGSSSPPQLSWSLSNSQFRLAWPADHTGWQLQAQTNPPGAGLGTNWFAVPGSDTVDSTNFPINPSDGSVFYRLVSP